MLASAAQFQGIWYFSVILIAILLLLGAGAIWALRAARALWRDGLQGPALVIGAAVAVGVIVVISIYAVGIGGVIASHGGPQS